MQLPQSHAGSSGFGIGGGVLEQHYRFLSFPCAPRGRGERGVRRRGGR
ncbi:protein of unknown function [Microbacterium sp. Nx66]|nr:protein of unknown function [Microbacterium sp. Nx66]